MDRTIDRIMEIRKEIGLQGDVFAQRININRTHLDMIEKGEIKPSYMVIKFICTEFDINEDWLLHGQGLKWKHSQNVNKKTACVVGTKKADEIIETYKQHFPIMEALEIGRETNGTCKKTDSEEVDVFNEIVENLLGRVITEEKQTHIIENAMAMLYAEQQIYYRYGLHDAIQFIMECLSARTTAPTQQNNVERIVSLILEKTSKTTS